MSITWRRQSQLSMRSYRVKSRQAPDAASAILLWGKLLPVVHSSKVYCNLIHLHVCCSTSTLLSTAFSVALPSDIRHPSARTISGLLVRRSSSSARRSLVFTMSSPQKKLAHSFSIHQDEEVSAAALVSRRAIARPERHALTCGCVARRKAHRKRFATPTHHLQDGQPATSRVSQGTNLYVTLDRNGY